MAAVQYVDLNVLSYYDSKIKGFITTADAEVLARSKVTIEALSTPTTGSAATYVVYQNYSEKGNPISKTKVEIGKIEIPLDRSLDSGKLVMTPATATEDAKAELIFTLANTTDATTSSGKEEVKVDISAIAGDLSEIAARVKALEDTHDIKTNDEGKTVLMTIEEEILAKAKNGEYTSDETIEEALKRFENDVTYKGEVTSMPSDPVKGDLCLFDIAATEDDAAITGWKIYNGTTWVDIVDKDLTARVSVLETQVGKDKEVSAYNDAEDLVDIVNILTGAVTEEGSVLKAIYDNAGDAYYDDILTKDADGHKPGDEDYTTTKIARTIREAIADVADAAEITVEKQETAEGTNLASYVVKQNGKQVGATINIPKDFLVKSASIKVAPEGGIVNGDETIPEGHKYIDFVINVKDGETEESHIYLDVLDLIVDFTVKSAEDVAADGDEIQLAVSEERELSATIVDGSIAREKIDADFEADLFAIEAAIGSTTDDEGASILYAVADRIKAEAKDGIYKPAIEADPENDIEGKAAVTIADAIAALEASAEGVTGALVFKGSITNLEDLPKIATRGYAYSVVENNNLYVCVASSTDETDAEFVQLAINGNFMLGDGALKHSVDVKTYIDSRIFIGTKDEIADAKALGIIDDSTFTVCTDEDAANFAPISYEEIDKLFE